MTPETSNRYNGKWPEEKIFFGPDLFLTKCIRIISCYRFLLKNAVFEGFFHQFVVVFLCISAGWESYMTPRQPIGTESSLQMDLLEIWDSDNCNSHDQYSNPYFH
jgi:hypothetical protein